MERYLIFSFLWTWVGMCSAISLGAVRGLVDIGDRNILIETGNMKPVITLRIHMLLGSLERRGVDVLCPWIKPGSEFKTFAHYARAAYLLREKWNCIPSCLVPETTGTVIDYTWHNSSPPSVGYIGHNDYTRIIIVAFRGTANAADWIQDSEFSFDPWPSHMPGSMVHHGFLDAYQSVSSKVTNVIGRLAAKYPLYKIVFTGHSLGGAQSAICAVNVLHQKPELKGRTHLYTYGMPRIGNEVWADSVDNLGIPIYRVVYENDLVPHIPFQWLGYRHFAQEVWIHQNKTEFCGKSHESLRCSASVALSDYSVPDHSKYAIANWEFSV